MKAVAQCRGDIYDYFHANAACQTYFFDSTHEQREESVQYYNSMYLLQDSTESLLRHRERGFSPDPLLAYIEFWGVMQAVIIQQDSICELYKVMLGKPLDAKAKNLSSWLEIRELRNICAGHPAKKDKPKNTPIIRSFMGRASGDYYNALIYERWQKGVGTTHPQVGFGALLDAYATEAKAQLAVVLAAIKSRWP